MAGRLNGAVSAWTPVSLSRTQAFSPATRPAPPQGLAPGEPWQRHVLLAGSSIPVEQWLARRMLRHGRCHFCCNAEPEPSRRHPEPALAPLVQLCTDCHVKLEADSWKG